MIIFAAIQDKYDQIKIETLYYQYRYLMYSEANKILHDHYLAEDAVHQSFIKIINNLHKIDEIICPRTRNYVVIICRNTALNLLKKRTYLNKGCNDIGETKINDNLILADPLNILINKESLSQIEAAIAALAPIYRDTLLLKEAYEYNNQDIANLMETSIETIKKRLFRARKLLIQALGGS